MNDIAKSLNSGPVIKKKGNAENKNTGIWKKINFSLLDIKVILFKLIYFLIKSFFL